MKEHTEHQLIGENWIHTFIVQEIEYPITDWIIDFIQNKGRNSKYCGCWKVYCNEYEAVKLFEKYKKCNRIYAQLWQQGRSVMQLTVAA